MKSIQETKENILTFENNITLIENQTMWQIM